MYRPQRPSPRAGEPRRRNPDPDEINPILRELALEYVQVVHAMGNPMSWTKDYNGLLKKADDLKARMFRSFGEKPSLRAIAQMEQIERMLSP